jgi:MFS family permease
MLPAMRGRFGVLGSVFRNPALLRLEAAYFFFAFGEWSTWVAVIVYAFGRGGAAEAGVVAFVELAPSLVLVPVVAGLGDRYPRARVLLGTYATQAILMGAVAAALIIGAPALLVYVLATLSATAVSFSRPVHASLLPEVVSSPNDLTAANVVTGMAESSGMLVGPLGAGLLVAVGGPTAVFLVAAAGNVIGAAALLGVARNARPVDPPPAAETSGIAELLRGIAAIRGDHRLRSVIAIASWATLLVGALDILYAVLAIDLLGLGESGVGFLGAIGGLGAMIGSGSALLLVGRERLALALGGSVALFGLAIAGLAVAPGLLPSLGLLLAAGVGSSLTAVAAQTMIQRLAGDDVMSRVFGALQGLAMGTTAVGALVVPAVIGLVGERAAFAIVGISLPLAFLALGVAIRSADRLDPARAAELRLLRGVPMLAPLSAPVLERLASGVSRIQEARGAVICGTGDSGDRFYVVDGGELEVDVAGRDVRHLGPGEAFGEIALVRDVPRTATVRALTDVSLLAIDREPFLAALTGQPRSRSIAVGLAEQRLAGDRSGA